MQTCAWTGTGLMHREGTSYSCLKPKEGANVQSSRKCARFTTAEGECPSQYSHQYQLQKDSDPGVPASTYSPASSS